jgi:eukaryotic-like serine/threonine-protein kinase
MSTTNVCPLCGTAYGSEQKFCPADGRPLRAQSPDDPLIGQVIADRYHITGLIGEGGMGRVYVAEHVRMGRRSALKVMSPALASTADAITRFNREASNASRINHPNVAAIYDFGETPAGLLYIAMEFVEGETLHALIARTGPLSIARAAQITKGAADALHAAHHLGIIHRDLKPDNVMLARQLDGGDWVKVVDFGIAKSVAATGQGGGGQTVTTAGVSLGTPEYMSPEQLAGDKLDHRTDIYSLGLVLFNMLTGELPYPKLTSKETLVRRLTSAPASLADVRPDVQWPAPVQAVLTRALDPEPDRRYGSVADLGRAIVAAAGSTPSDDADATMRVASVRRATPAFAATAAHGPPPAAARSPTRQLVAADTAPRRRRARGLGAAAVLLLVAAGGYLVMRPRSGTGTGTAPITTAVPATPQPQKSTANAGGSAPRPPAPGGVADSLAAVLGEIRGHLDQGGQDVARGTMRAANRELRTGQAEMKRLRERPPAGSLPPMLVRELRELGAHAVRACYAAAGSDPQAVQRCRLFQQREARGRSGRAPVE